MNHWLFKSEPEVFSFADLKARPGRREPWNGVRNYQARNYMRDAMSVGDVGIFYHSNCPQPGIAGLMKVASEARPDPTQFDPSSEYFDPKSTPTLPRWQLVEVSWLADFPRFVSLDELRGDPALDGMLLLRRGNRLSITPVERRHFEVICRLGGLAAREIPG